MSFVSDIAYVLFLVRDIDRARHFYENQLGFTLSASSQHGAWLEFDLGAGTLAVTSRLEALGGHPGSGGAVVSLEVSDWDEMVERLSQHAIPWQVGPVDARYCRGGIVTDPDGNRIMFHQRKALLK